MTDMTDSSACEVRELKADSADLEPVLALLQRCFAFMEERIDPPSSLHQLNPDILRRHCAGPVGQEIWCLGRPPMACVFFTPKADALYLGRLAVDPAWRGQGVARRLVRCAAQRARALGLEMLELQVRIKLVENQQVFSRLGFDVIAETMHPGFDRVTSLTMRCPIVDVLP